MNVDVRFIDRVKALPYLSEAARFDTGSTMDDVHGAAYLGVFDKDHGDAFVGAYMLHMQDGALHIRAAGGFSQHLDLTDVGLQSVIAQAKTAGLARVTFQTKRRALIRKAQRHGFKVCGYILEAEV